VHGTCDILAGQIHFLGAVHEMDAGKQEEIVEDWTTNYYHVDWFQQYF